MYPSKVDQDEGENEEKSHRLAGFVNRTDQNGQLLSKRELCILVLKMAFYEQNG